MALYKLVYSTYLWFSDLKGILEDFGHTWLKYDDVLFYNTFQSLYITIYVDNIKAFYLDDTIILTLKKYLQLK